MDHNRIHFGTIGLKIGDEISFRDSRSIFVVASGNGTPKNGGTLLSYKESQNIEAYSVRSMTRRLMGDEFNDELDVWSYWKYKGKTLRSIYNERVKENGVLSTASHNQKYKNDVDPIQTRD